MGEKVWAVLGLVTMIFSGLLIIIGFSTPYWMETDEGRIISTQLERLGLWEICFRLYSDSRDPFGRIYNGCWWIFAREYDGIREYILKAWFATAQALITLALLLSLLALLCGILILMNCFTQNLKLYMTYALTLGCYLICVLVGVGAISFGVHADSDQSWLKQPRLRHLSWSFWVTAIGGLLALLGAMFYTVYSVKLRAGGHRSTAYRAHELRHYRNDRYYR